MNSLASAAERSTSVPGSMGMPRARRAARASTLLPSSRMASGEGPMKRIPVRPSTSANTGFSDKKPQPGCTASAPVISAALMMAGTLR